MAEHIVNLKNMKLNQYVTQFIGGQTGSNTLPVNIAYMPPNPL